MQNCCCSEGKEVPLGLDPTPIICESLIAIRPPMRENTDVSFGVTVITENGYDVIVA
jgi:hypothetical protein